ncbi:Ral guanine nucleotide dissociation stimulator-like 1, variant 2 [Dermatophagoides farinae]|uniref:Ral guanine nucleotide dissociation stimulator-like 1, variant 2 n=1 Tax=Dermatophagoides farinae TaxID=6954 RepID=A0A922LD44_DERFA|nr:Ral guanine nucleotide dissociation stimulator-like 1, variant 2 [Dermatophagoides farinae]
MMPTPTISLAATAYSANNNNNMATTNANNNHEKNNRIITQNNHLGSMIITKSNGNNNDHSDQKSVMAQSSIDSTNGGPQIMNNDHQSRLRRHMTEEINEDSIYNVYLKKITYTFNNVLNKQQKLKNDNFITRCDQVDYSSSTKEQQEIKKNGGNKWNHHQQQQEDQQSLQWETRQLRQIKAATLEHLVQYILLQTEYQQQHHNHSKSSQHHHHNDHSDSDEESQLESSDLIEERNNVAHVMHVLFATYRQFCYPWQLFTEIIRQKPFASSKQFNFILFYWLNNYPEDFWTPCQPSMTNPNTNYIDDHTCSPDHGNQIHDDQSSLCSEYASSSSLSSNLVSYTATSLSLSSTSNNVSTDSSQSSTSSSSLSRFSPLTLADQLISMRHIDEEVKKHCLHLLDMKKENTFNSSTLNHHPYSSIHKSVNKSSSIIELDAKFVAQQLTAIDLENFLALKPYTLLSSVRTKTKIETMIRNFNLLSRHVIITILQHSTPHLVTVHWIEIAQQLRKMRNFNSLKAIIAGLTNESIYRLKTTVWNRLSRNSMTTFQNTSSIVDDVNNQTMLRHTQLFIEGTSKVSLEDSFGTVPYLGTFLTDITMINTRYDNYIKIEKGKKLINFEKCAKQYEILMQMHLLQKNAIAALQQQQQQNYQHQIYSLNHYLSLRSQSVPSIPRVARIFRNWFQLNESDLPSDRECYQISLGIESPATKNGKK